MVDWPKAMLSTTFAVLRPTPGSVCRVSRSSGTLPPNSSIRIARQRDHVLGLHVVEADGLDVVLQLALAELQHLLRRVGDLEQGLGRLVDRDVGRLRGQHHRDQQGVGIDVVELAARIGIGLRQRGVELLDLVRLQLRQCPTRRHVDAAGGDSILRAMEMERRNSRQVARQPPMDANLDRSDGELRDARRLRGPALSRTARLAERGFLDPHRRHRRHRRGSMAGCSWCWAPGRSSASWARSGCCSGGCCARISAATAGPSASGSMPTGWCCSRSTPRATSPNAASSPIGCRSILQRARLRESGPAAALARAARWRSARSSARPSAGNSPSSCNPSSPRWRSHLDCSCPHNHLASPAAIRSAGLEDFGLLLLLALTWGSSFYFIKEAVDTLPPLSLAVGRIAIGAALLLAIAHAKGQAVPRGLEPLGPHGRSRHHRQFAAVLPDRLGRAIHALQPGRAS